MDNANAAFMAIAAVCFYLFGLQHRVLSCQSRYSAPPLVGQKCLSNHDTETFATKSVRYCILKCLSENICYYVNHNTKDGECYLGYNICSALAIAPDFTMMRFHPKRQNCTEWLPYTVNPYPGGLVTMSTGLRKQFVARVEHQSQFVPGKLHPDYQNSFWTSLGTQIINHYQAQNVAAVEVLTIDVACLQFWVALEIGSSLPEGTLPTGHLSDGTLLYTARFWAGSELIYGHYNPQTKRAHGEQGELNLTIHLKSW